MSCMQTAIGYEPLTGRVAAGCWRAVCGKAIGSAGFADDPDSCRTVTAAAYTQQLKSAQARHAVYDTLRKHELCAG